MTEDKVQTTELDRVRRKIALGYFVLVDIIFVLFLGYYWYTSIDTLTYTILIAIAFHGVLFFVPYMLSYPSFQPLVLVYLVLISLIMGFQLFVFWQFGQITTFIWFALFPVAAMIFYSRRMVVYVSIYIVTYVSKAIKINKDLNFNTFINTYRINMVKEMLNNDFHNKYTMRHIYTSSGFRNQSTFNKIFKQIAGVTPSEYIKNLERRRKKS